MIRVSLLSSLIQGSKDYLISNINRCGMPSTKWSEMMIRTGCIVIGSLLINIIAILLLTKAVARKGKDSSNSMWQ